MVMPGQELSHVKNAESPVEDPVGLNNITTLAVRLCKLYIER